MSDVYVQKSDYRLSLCQDRMVIRDRDSCIVKEISVKKISNLLLFGDSQVSTQLVKFLMKEGVGIYYFSKIGYFLGRADSFQADDFEKQSLQLRACQDEELCLSLAKKVIGQKMSLQIQLLKDYDRFDLLVADDFEGMEGLCQRAEEALSLAELMGYEGRMAKSYFYYLGLLVPKGFRFNGRSKRPARDPFNAMLNLGYSLLHSYMIGYIRKSGLHPGIGFLHKSRPHHASLASDLMEVWRVVMVDDTVLRLVLSEEVRRDDFEEDSERGYRLLDEGRKVFMETLRQRFLEIHQYIELDKKRYTFPYMVELQLLSLVNCFQQGDAQCFLTIAEEATDEEVL